jgi:crossover junction endodeoxyribonuclease RuvC
MQATVILGIDPGLRITGYAVLKQEQQQSCALEYSYLKLINTRPVAERVTTFHDFFTEKIKQYRITHIALETPFLSKNVQAFLKLGYLRGIVYLLSQKYKCQLHEFSPRQVKASVTGFGGAQKEQVAAMVMRMFSKLSDVRKTYKSDVTDALAISLCGLWHMGQHKF